MPCWRAKIVKTWLQSNLLLAPKYLRLLPKYEKEMLLIGYDSYREFCSSFRAFDVVILILRAGLAQLATLIMPWVALLIQCRGMTLKCIPWVCQWFITVSLWTASSFIMLQEKQLTTLGLVSPIAPLSFRPRELLAFQIGNHSTRLWSSNKSSSKLSKTIKSETIWPGKSRWTVWNRWSLKNRLVFLSPEHYQLNRAI